MTPSVENGFDEVGAEGMVVIGQRDAVVGSPRNSRLMCCRKIFLMLREKRKSQERHVLP
jgi:hypothetical protein